jgi:hypothetical protein
VSSSPPSGITPASSFELAGFEPELPAPAILADKIDPHTGDFASLTTGYGIADGLALFLLSVQRGSGSAVRGFGQRFREITHVDAQAPHSYEAFVREALDPGIRSGTLRFERVSVTVDEGDPTQLNPQVDYVDLLAAPKSRDRNRTFSR